MPCKTCHFSTCRCSDLSESFKLRRSIHGRWPLTSESAGVLPSQIEEGMAEAKRLGTHISYTRDGRAIFDSYQHQKEYCKAIGMVDLSRENTQPKRQTMLERSPKHSGSWVQRERRMYGLPT